MKNILLAAITLLLFNCNNYKRISTCDISTEKLSKQHILVRLIKIDTLLNDKTTFSEKCSFYQAFELNKNDTLYLIDIHSVFKGDDLNRYIENNSTFMFFPIAQDSCMTCSFKSGTSLNSLKGHTYIVGTLKIIER
jgi:hypothetical protein